jgi:hypothetical protein
MVTPPLRTPYFRDISMEDAGRTPPNFAELGAGGASVLSQQVGRREHWGR